MGIELERCWSLLRREEGGPTGLMNHGCRAGFFSLSATHLSAPPHIPMLPCRLITLAYITLPLFPRSQAAPGEQQGAEGGLDDKETSKKRKEHEDIPINNGLLFMN